MAAYSTRGTEEKSAQRQEVEARQHIRWTIFSSRSAGGGARAMLACWPTAASINVNRPSARMTKANDEANITTLYSIIRLCYAKKT